VDAEGRAITDTPGDAATGVILMSCEEGNSANYDRHPWMRLKGQQQKRLWEALIMYEFDVSRGLEVAQCFA
jgi:hypothetical protein